MKYYLIVLALSFFTMFSALHAQAIIPIAKSEVLRKVTQDNTSLKIAEQEFFESRADFRQTNAVFLPNITASHTGIATTNPLMAFGSKLNQEILTQQDFDPTVLNDPSQVQSFATKFEFQQPILNLDGVYHRKAARSKMNAMSLKQQRTGDYITLEVEKSYMQLQLAYKGVEVLEFALQTALENKKIADNSYNQGYLQRADVLNIEVRVTEVRNQLQSAKSNVLNASNYVSFLMNDNTDVIYQPSDALVIITLTEALDQGISENRSDIKAMQLASTAYEAMNKADKMAFLPRLNAFGSYELYDNQLFQASANGYLFGAQLTWDIFQGSKRIGKAQKSKAEFEKSKLAYDQYMSKSNLELNTAKRMLLDAQNKLNLTTLAMEQSKESLRIRGNRFKEGLEKTSDLLLAETKYAQKQLAYYQTIYEYNYAQAYLRFLVVE